MPDPDPRTVEKMAREEALMYADLNHTRRRYPVEPTAEAIRAAEARKLVAPDPETFARRSAILDGSDVEEG